MNPLLSYSGDYYPIQLDITNICNLNCTHCYHSNHKNDGAIDLNGWITIIDQYKKFIVKYDFKPLVLICGGEPTLSQFFDPILDYLDTHFNSPVTKLKLVIISNGTRPDKINFEKIKKFDPTIQISFDGHDEITHDSVRGKGSFAKTVAGIAKIQSEKIAITILSILSKRTSFFIEEMFGLCVSLKIKSIGFTRLIGVGKGQQLEQSGNDRPLTSDELQLRYMQIVIQSAKHNIRTNTNSPLYALLSSDLGSSGQFWKAFIIDYKGNILISSRSRFIIGNAVTDSLEKVAIENPIINQLRMGKIDKCQNCKFLKVCGGDRNAAYAASGSFLSQDPACWIINQNAS